MPGLTAGLGYGGVLDLAQYQSSGPLNGKAEGKGELCYFGPIESLRHSFLALSHPVPILRVSFR